MPVKAGMRQTEKAPQPSAPQQQPSLGPQHKPPVPQQRPPNPTAKPSAKPQVPLGKPQAPSQTLPKPANPPTKPSNTPFQQPTGAVRKTRPGMTKPAVPVKAGMDKSGIEMTTLNADTYLQ